MKARYSKFSLQSEQTFKGYTFDEEWNGFAVPYFEITEVSKISDMLLENGYELLFIDGELTYIDEDYDEIEVIPMEIIDTIDGVKSVYAVGARAWCWEDEQYN